MHNKAYLEGYLSKDASALQLLRHVPKYLKKAPGAFNDATASFRRYVSRKPELAHGQLHIPTGAKKIKTAPGRIKSYVDPETGFKHTDKAPGWASTLTSAVTQSPRILPNPKADNVARRTYQAATAGTAATAGYLANEERKAFDRGRLLEAQAARAQGNPAMAKIHEQSTSGNIAKRLVGAADPTFPAESPLAPLNEPIQKATWPAIIEAARAKAIQVGEDVKQAPAGGTNRLQTILKALAKPPAVSMQIPQRAAGLLGLEPRTTAESAQHILKETLTPEVQSAMEETPNGMVLSKVMQLASKLPAEQAQRLINAATEVAGKAKSDWSEGVASIDINEIIQRAGIFPQGEEEPTTALNE